MRVWQLIEFLNTLPPETMTDIIEENITYNYSSEFLSRMSISLKRDPVQFDIYYGTRPTMEFDKKTNSWNKLEDKK